jgi:signal transduction histidine kinase
MFSNINIKIIASLLSAFILLVGIIVILSSSAANDLLKERIENQFLSESFGRGEAIRTLMEIYYSQVNQLAYRLSNDKDIRSTLVANEQEGISHPNGESIDLPILNQKIEEFGVTFENSTQIRNIKIMDGNGKVLLSSNPSETGHKEAHFGIIKPKSNATPNFGTANIELSKVNGENRQLIKFIMPFNIEQQQSPDKIGNPNANRLFISAGLDTSSFDKILLNRKGLGESGEAYLVNSSGVMVSESRFINHSSPITVDTVPVRQCFESTNGGDAGGIYNDYRNIPIVGFSYCAKDLGFVLLAEIDKSEVIQPIDNLRNTMVTVSVISCLILTVISVVVIHTLLSWNKTLELTNKKLQSVNKKLQNRDKMQREFINIAAHELRTPIQPVLALAEQLRERTKDKEQIQLLDIVIRNARRLKKLSDNILDVTKIESNALNMNKEIFSIEELILESIKDFEDNLKVKGIKFEFRNINNVRNVFADKNRIGQVISGMIGNSVKFIGKEGTISITAERKKVNQDGIGNKEKDVVVVCVKDTGTGIDTEILPKLFTKFASKSFQGTGLGLYISKKIVEAHGGMVLAENNNDGKGAKFSFSLPLGNSGV